MWLSLHRKDWRGVALFLLSLLPAMIVVNLSLVIGWGGLRFFDSGYRLFLSIFLSLEILLARLFENADTGIRTVERQAWVALFGPFWILFNMASAWTLRRSGATSVYVAGLGVGLFSIGLGLRVWSARTLGRFFSWHVTVFSGHRLITEGPYAISRHPAYLGSVVQIVGLGFMFHAPFVAAAGLVVFAVVLVLRIRDEEILMNAAFPGLYAAYQKRVPVLFPFLTLRGSAPVDLKEGEELHDRAN
jgi:protein-S-isoprenylcysteine O-methyltransferase Ste14